MATNNELIINDKTYQIGRVQYGVYKETKKYARELLEKKRMDTLERSRKVYGEDNVPEKILLWAAGDIPAMEIDGMMENDEDVQEYFVWQILQQNHNIKREEVSVMSIDDIGRIIEKAVPGERGQKKTPTIVEPKTPSAIT